MVTGGRNLPGFQGSETSRPDVTIHRHGSEPGLNQEPGELRLGGRHERDDEPSLVGLTVNKTIGGGAGTFTLDVKASTTDDFDMLEAVSEDDWVDIVGVKHNRRFHVMRGLIDDVRRARTVIRGATSTVYRISGRDFGKIFEMTPIWFNRLTEGTNDAGAMIRVFDRHAAFRGDVATTVEAVLAGFIRELADKGRAVYKLPTSLPVIGVGSFFYENCAFYKEDFFNTPQRANPIVGPEFSPRQSNVWSYAQEWSDPMLCELYVDLMQRARPGGTSVRTDKGFPTYSPAPAYLGTPQGDTDLTAVEADVEDTIPTIIFRSRPFPNSIDPGGVGAGLWFKKIPLYIEPMQGLAALDTGRSGYERKNAYFAAPALFQEHGPGYLDLQVPLQNEEDIEKHGFRRMDITSRYVTNTPDLLTLSKEYREKIRDFHMLNHLWLNGTATLGHGRPDIRVGGRFRVLGHSSPDNDETYYIESLSHSWSYRQGWKTSLGLTRGWVGTDEELGKLMQEVKGKYAPDLNNVEKAPIAGGGDIPEI